MHPCPLTIRVCKLSRNKHGTSKLVGATQQVRENMCDAGFLDVDDFQASFGFFEHCMYYVGSEVVVTCK